MTAKKETFSTILKKVEHWVRKISLFPLNKKKLCIRLILLTLIILGAVLRLYDLTSRPFIADEAISTMAAIDISKTGYPPTMPGGTEYWRSIFHTSTMAVFFQYFGISVFVARLPSVMIGTLTILLIYYFGKELMNWKVGLVAAFLMSVNVLAIDLSREARMYAFFQFFYLLSLLLFYKGFEGKRGKIYHLFKERIILENIRPLYLILFGAIFVISLLCHRLTIMILLGILGYGILIGLIERKRSPSSKKPLDKYLTLFILSIVVIIVGFFIGISTGFRHQITSITEYIEFDLGAVIYSILYYGLYILEHFPIEFCFAVLGIVIIIYNRKKNGVFILVSLLIPLLIQIFFFNFIWVGPKYIFHLIPLFLILSAYGIYEVARYLKAFEYLKVPENVKPRLFCIILCVLLIFAGYSYAYLATQRGKIASPYWREACKYVLINSKNKTSLITSVDIIPYFYLESEEYGLRQEYKEYAYKNISIYDRPYLHTRSVLENFTRTHDNGWVLVDMDRWNWEEVITEDAKKYLQENMTFHPYKYHMYLLLYSWGYE